MVQLIALETVNLYYYPSSPSALLCCHLKALGGGARLVVEKAPLQPHPSAQALFLLGSQGRNCPVVPSAAYI